MAVRLGKREAGSFDLPNGVRLTVKPADAVLFELAEVIARKDAQRMKEGHLAAAAYGLDDEAMAAADGGAPLNTMAIVALGRLTITAWEGVEDDEGKPLPADPATIAHLLRATAAGGFTYGELFSLQMRARSLLKADAKNVSTVSPDGSTGAAVIGAESARSPGVAETENP